MSNCNHAYAVIQHNNMYTCSNFVHNRFEFDRRRPFCAGPAYTGVLENERMNYSRGRHLCCWWCVWQSMLLLLLLYCCICIITQLTLRIMFIQLPLLNSTITHALTVVVTQRLRSGSVRDFHSIVVLASIRANRGEGGRGGDSNFPRKSYFEKYAFCGRQGLAW